MYLHVYNISMHVQVLYMNIQVNSTANKATVTGCIWYVLCTITVETHQDKLTGTHKTSSCYLMFFLSGFACYVYTATANQIVPRNWFVLSRNLSLRCLS